MVRVIKEILPVPQHLGFLVKVAHSLALVVRK